MLTNIFHKYLLIPNISSHTLTLSSDLDIQLGNSKIHCYLPERYVVAEDYNFPLVLGVGARPESQEHLLSAILQSVRRPVHVPLQIPAEDLGTILAG